MIEVCLVVYKRHYRLPELMTQLRKQTCQDFRLWIWNNKPGKWVDVRNFDKKRTVVINSPTENIGSKARFELAKKTSGSPIIFIDDDSILKPDFIEYYKEQHEKFGGICGWWAKRFDTEDYNRTIAGIPYGEEADYIGTGGMIMGRELLDLVGVIPDWCEKAEDLWLSYKAREIGVKLISIGARCRIVHDGYDQYKGLIQYKQSAFEMLREKGWKLLREI